LSKVSTGIKGLDEMLKGGLMKGDVTLVAGSSGTGKTILGLQFLVTGATKFGENGVYISFEQLPQQIYRDAKNFGWDLRKLEEEGKLRVVCTSPGLVLEREGLALEKKAPRYFLDDPVEEIGAQRVVIDPINHLEMVVRDPVALRQEIYTFTNHLKMTGLTSILTHEIPGIVGGELRISDFGLGFIVDGLILLRFVEVESSVKKALAILKMRGSDHEKSLREFDITGKGIEVKGEFKGKEGVLTGSARSSALAETLMKVGR